VLIVDNIECKSCISNYLYLHVDNYIVEESKVEGGGALLFKFVNKNLATCDYSHIYVITRELVCLCAGSVYVGI